MAKLDLYTGREPHIIEVEIGGEKKELKIPSDYTEEEIERILEIEEKMENNNDAEQRWQLIFSQLSLLFRRYQPDITVEKLKSILTRTDVLKIINFISEHNFAVSRKNDEGEIADKKKQRVKN